MARSPLLVKQWALYDGLEFEHARRETHTELERLKGEERRDAERLIGLCWYRQRQYDEAERWFQFACQGSTDSNDWLRLALAATRRGNLQQGVDAFEQTRICQQVAKFAQPPGIYLQAYGYALALTEARDWVRLRPILEELGRVYERVFCTDTAFLYRLGVPFLVSFLALAQRFFREQGQYVQGLAWLQTLALSLDDEGKRQVSRAMRELRETDAGGATP